MDFSPDGKFFVLITSERLYIFPINEDFETMFDQIHFEEDQKFVEIQDSKYIKFD